MRRRRPALADRAAFACVAALALVAAPARASVAPAPQNLQLEVFINGLATNLVGGFVAERERLSAQRQELGELGLAVGKDGDALELVPLESVAGLTYRYDVPGQRLYIDIPDTLRAEKVYGPASASELPTLARADFGTVLNYNLFATSSGHREGGGFGFSGMSATLEGRAFSPFGALTQSAIVRTRSGGATETLRLNTAFTYSDPQALMEYRVGDAISGGFAWTRPIRLGGAQAQRSFALRPDLVTLPLASVSGSAAVPSTLDVYVNNLKTYSQDVSNGPYRITNIPAVTGSGEARIVLRDAAGHETATTVPLYSSARLLAPGLFDFSFEAGLPRIGFATTLDGYVDRPVGSASWRQGVLDWLTLEGHAEGMQGLVNGGVGGVVRVGSLGAASLALSASATGSAKGAQSFASYETTIGPVNLNLSSQIAFGQYRDLASETARFTPSGKHQSLLQFFSAEACLRNVDGSPLFRGAEVPLSVNRISAGMPLAWDNSSVSGSFIDLQSRSIPRSRIVTASYSRPLPYGAYLTATAFTDLGRRRETGALVGFSVPLGGDTMASVGLSRGREGMSLVADAAKPLGPEPGSIGWRARANDGFNAEQSAIGAYRTTAGWVEAGIGYGRRGAVATAQFDGAIATLGTDVFLANRIDDSFAVVEAGSPGVAVLYENRRVGTTDSNGRMLVTGIRSYQQNTIAIDTTNLPVTADVDTTQTVVTPRDRSGVRVSFGVQTDAMGAVLVLTGADGRPLPPGVQGTMEGGQVFVVGYDGRAFVKGLRPRNSVTLTATNGVCQASFDYQPLAGEQVVIPIVCR